MSIRVSVRELQEQLPDLLDRAVESGKECVVERDGEDYAVIVSAREWRRRAGTARGRHGSEPSLRSAESKLERIGRKLDALGPEYRFPPDKQARVAELAEQHKSGTLDAGERNELERLLAEADAVMLRRAKALDRIA